MFFSHIPVKGKDKTAIKIYIFKVKSFLGADFGKKFPTK